MLFASFMFIQYGLIDEKTTMKILQIKMDKLKIDKMKLTRILYRKFSLEPVNYQPFRMVVFVLDLQYFVEFLQEFDPYLFYNV
mgnify:CR=1 FL=1